MNKTHLINAIADDASISKASAKKALNSFITNVTNTLSKGGRVSMVGFGTFTTSKRSSREGRNPQTGEKIQIPTKIVTKFRASSELNSKL